MFILVLDPAILLCWAEERLHLNNTNINKSDCREKKNKNLQILHEQMNNKQVCGMYELLVIFVFRQLCFSYHSPVCT